jgi:hypothetical protein
MQVLLLPISLRLQLYCPVFKCKQIQKFPLTHKNPMGLVPLTAIWSTMAWALSLTFCTCCLTFSAACCCIVTFLSTSSAFVFAMAKSFSFTASSLLNSFTDSDASINFFRPFKQFDNNRSVKTTTDKHRLDQIYRICFPLFGGRFRLKSKPLTIFPVIELIRSIIRKIEAHVMTWTFQVLCSSALRSKFDISFRDYYNHRLVLTSNSFLIDSTRI